MLSEKGKSAFQEKETGVEFLLVFGTMQFGAEALKNLGEEKFFYRTGIALGIWEKQAERRF